MSKITLKEFFESKDKLAIRCKTIGEAIRLCNECDFIGQSIEPEINLYEQEDFIKNACYTNDRQYLTIDKLDEYTIYKIEDIDFEVEKQINDNVKKFFEMLNLKPYKKFELNGGGIYYLDIYLNIYDVDGEYVYPEDFNIKTILLEGITTDIKPKPQKKRLRDWSYEEFEKYRSIKCKKDCSTCDECVFKNVNCHLGDNCWVLRKDVFSDNFLDQVIEIPLEEEEE